MKRILPLLACLLITGTSLAQSTKTPRTIATPEHVYKDAVITSYDAEGVNIRYPGGMALIPIAQVPADLLKELGLKSATQLAQEQKQAADDAKQKADDKLKLGYYLDSPKLPTHAEAHAFFKMSEADLIAKLGHPVSESTNPKGDVRILTYSAEAYNKTEFMVWGGIVHTGSFRGLAFSGMQ